MSYVIATPEMMATAAFDLARIGSQVSAASAVAAMPTTEVVAAGADEVSAGIAALFSAHAQEYQALSAQAAAFHDQFVHTLTAAARWYTATEIANAAAMRGRARSRECAHPDATGTPADRRWCARDSAWAARWGRWIVVRQWRQRRCRCRRAGGRRRRGGRVIWDRRRRWRGRGGRTRRYRRDGWMAGGWGRRRRYGWGWWWRRRGGWQRGPVRQRRRRWCRWGWWWRRRRGR
ncbi:PE-PGRS family protein PE_PGRS43 [Mycobacterium tuberculosis variant bovis]|nr:PE-PGRS family protein PE_PGRS43 [Mycobacterium tuberculosis variant bovis]